MAYEELIGHEIESVDLADDEHAIRFNLRDGDPLVYITDGDCCSFTWIESIDAPELLLGKVLAAEDIAMPEQIVERDHDVVAFYGLKITTDKGIAIIDYRNDSNGYYGGSLELQGNGHYYGGVYSQNESKFAWKRLTVTSPASAS